MEMPKEIWFLIKILLILLILLLAVFIVESIWLFAEATLVTHASATGMESVTSTPV